MPFFIRPRRRPPLLLSVATGAFLVAFMCAIRVVAFGPVALLVAGPRLALLMAGWAILTSGLAGAAGGATYTLLGSAASHRTALTRWLASTLVAAAGIGTVLLLFPLAPIPLGEVEAGSVSFAGTLLASAPILGGILAGIIFRAEDATELYYLTPKEVAELPEAERGQLQPDPPRQPREGDDGSVL